VRRGQLGVAVVVALLVVALVAYITAAGTWQLLRDVEREAAERRRVQISWLFFGVLEWSRVTLVEDAISSGADHLGEAWADPLPEKSISAFLTTGSAGERTAGEFDDGSISGTIIDLNSALDIGGILGTGSDERSLRMLGRLFEALSLPKDQFERINRRLSHSAEARTRELESAALLGWGFEQPARFGLSAETTALLAPYVAILPSRAPVNINTAPAEVIYAAVDGISLEDARELVVHRQKSPFMSKAEAARLVSNSEGFNSEQVGVASRFFELRAHLRMGALNLQERSLLERDQTRVSVLRRERASP
jgi:general secretion pathway protein K